MLRRSQFFADGQRMGFYGEQVVPRLVHFAMRGEPINAVRQRTLATASGVVLEIGFGSGLNLRYYPAAVTKVLAVEPAAVAQKLAAKYIARRGLPVEYAGLDGQKLALPDASVACAVSTWTLCTIPDAAAALREVARVLKPGGMFLFVEHGLAASPRVAKWQRRLEPMQKVVAGGCHLTRDMAALIGASPLKIEQMENFYMPGPKTHTYLYLGSAKKA